MAQQRHRQACLAHWPGHHSLNTETRRRSRNSQEFSRRSKAEDHGGDTTAQPRLWQQVHHPEAAMARGRHRARGRVAEHSMATTPGLQTAIQPTRRRRVTASTQELGRKLQRGQPEQIEPQGRDPLSGAQWRWRRLEARTTNPHGQEEAHGEAEHMRQRAAVELAGAHQNQARNLSAIRNRHRGLGLGTDREGGRVSGRPAGPSRFGQAHSG
jgi:hypothetical protein